MKIIVIGAGPSGLMCSYKLKEKGFSNIPSTLINCFDITINILNFLIFLPFSIPEKK